MTLTDAEIAERCARAGLPLRAVERRRGVLLLKPTTLDSLPSPEDLSLLATELQASAGMRWVALDLEDST